MARTPHHGSAALALGVVVVLLLAGCGDGDTEDPGPRAHVTTSTTQAAAPSSTASDVSTSTPSTPEEQVKAAYVDAARSLDYALTDPDSGVSSLDGHFGSVLLARIEQRLAELKASNHLVHHSGFGVRLPEVTSVAVSVDSAVVSGCVVNDLVVVDAASGAVVDDSAHSIRFEATLELRPTGWTVVDDSMVARWDDSLGCRGEA